MKSRKGTHVSRRIVKYAANIPGIVEYFVT